MRTNTYDPVTNRVTISPERAAVYQQLAEYYANVFSAGRKEYAIPQGALLDSAKQREMADFFWWTSWAASTNRLNGTTTYTNNWPHEPLVGNQPTTGAILWSFISVVCLIGGTRLIGAGPFAWENRQVNSKQLTACASGHSRQRSSRQKQALKWRNWANNAPDP
jgi:nitric oxide reductase large subunit